MLIAFTYLHLLTYLPLDLFLYSPFLSLHSFLHLCDIIWDYFTSAQRMSLSISLSVSLMGIHFMVSFVWKCLYLMSFGEDRILGWLFLSSPLWSCYSLSSDFCYEVRCQFHCSSFKIIDFWLILRCFSLSLVFNSITMLHLGVVFFVFFLLEIHSFFLSLWLDDFSHIWKVLNHNNFKDCFCPILFLLSFFMLSTCK